MPIKGGYSEYSEWVLSSSVRPPVWNQVFGAVSWQLRVKGGQMLFGSDEAAVLDHGLFPASLCPRRGKEKLRRVKYQRSQGHCGKKRLVFAISSEVPHSGVFEEPLKALRG